MKSCHLCKEDYDEVRQRVSMRQAAEFYGFPVNARGLCRCPFHDDKRPSMKIYPDGRGYYCFSCGAGGDVVKFVAGVYGLGNEEAARKLIEDFALPIDLEHMTYREKREREKRIKKRRELQKFKGYAHATLTVYRQLLCDAIQNPEDPHFVEAAQELTLVEYRLECLERREDLERYYSDRKAVEKLGTIRDRVIGWYG